MQVIPLFCTNESDECNEHGPDDPQDFGRFGCVRRFLRPATSQPYNLSRILALWVLFNLGLISPVLSLAIVSQVLMGTVYVSWQDLCERGPRATCFGRSLVRFPLN